MADWTRDDIDRALGEVLFNANNYPNPSQMMGRDTGPLRKKCMDAVWEVVRPDPVESLASELEQAARDALLTTVALTASTFGVPMPAMDIDAMLDEIDWRQAARNHLGVSS